MRSSCLTRSLGADVLGEQQVDLRSPAREVDLRHLRDQAVPLTQALTTARLSAISERLKTASLRSQVARNS